MGKQSSLGPIDPQISQGNLVAPAGAVLDQFDLAKAECSDPKKVNAWIPILPQYSPALLKQCKYAQELAEDLVTKWLTDYMFKDDSNAEAKAQEIASKLAAHGSHKTHGRQLTRATIRDYGLTVDALEDDQQLQDLTLSVYHSTTLMFLGSPIVKIIENDAGKSFMKAELQQNIGMMLPQIFPQMQPQPQLPPAILPPSP